MKKEKEIYEEAICADRFRPFLLAYKDRAAREAGWAGFGGDARWTELRTKYFVPITTKVYMMSATDYSPLK